MRDSSIPHLHYPGETLESVLRKDILPNKKTFGKTGETPGVTVGIRTG
jgi:hypothetical protein